MVMEKNRHELDVKKPPSNAKKDEEKPNKRKTVSTLGNTEQSLPDEVIPRPRQVVERTSKRQAVSQWAWTVESNNKSAWTVDSSL